MPNELACCPNGTTLPRPQVVIPQRVRDTIERVCADHGVYFDELLERSRYPYLVAARHEAMAAVRRLRTPVGRPFSYSQIGRIFDRDHSTVMHACRKWGVS